MFTKMMQSLRDVSRLLSRRIVIVPVIVAITALCLSASVLSIHTYVVHDGAEMLVHRSYEDNPERLLANIGKPLQELDEIQINEQEDGKKEITILRAQEVSVKADGKQNTIRVKHDDTVDDALMRAGIQLGQHDEVTPDKNQIVRDGTQIQVSRVSITQTLKTVDIPFEKIVKKTDNLESGKTRLAQQGQKGQKQQTYEVMKKDGSVVSEKLLKEVVVTQPKNEITEKGTHRARSSRRSGTLQTSRGGAPTRYKKVMDVVATAYSSELISNKYTATGAIARVGLIAVDPRVIPLGTRMYITSADGKSWIYGHAVAADTGGAIKGNKIDLFFNTERECWNFGRQRAKVYILE